MTQLEQNYINACNAYLKAFCEKHGYDFDDATWIHGVGEIAEFSDYYADMVTIKIDIDREAKVDEFIKWYDYTLRLGMLDCSGIPNFENWLRRCPIKSEEEILKMEATRRKIEDLKNELKKMCDGTI